MLIQRSARKASNEAEHPRMKRCPRDPEGLTKGARRTVEIWYKLTEPMWTHGKNVKEEGLTTIHENCPQQKEELD